jgi:hypothetical protein
VPVVTESEGLLTSTVAAGYQWFLNGAPINGATEGSFAAETGGWYQVQVFDENGCSSTSDSLQVIITGTDMAEADAPRIWPSPAGSVLFMEVASPGEVEVLDAAGRVVLRARIGAGGAQPLDISGLAPGPYLLCGPGTKRSPVRFTKD